MVQPLRASSAVCPRRAPRGGMVRFACPVTNPVRCPECGQLPRHTQAHGGDAPQSACVRHGVARGKWWPAARALECDVRPRGQIAACGRDAATTRTASCLALTMTRFPTLTDAPAPMAATHTRQARGTVANTSSDPPRSGMTAPAASCTPSAHTLAPACRPARRSDATGTARPRVASRTASKRVGTPQPLAHAACFTSTVASPLVHSSHRLHRRTSALIRLSTHPKRKLIWGALNLSTEPDPVF